LYSKALASGQLISLIKSLSHFELNVYVAGNTSIIIPENIIILKYIAFKCLHFLNAILFIIIGMKDMLTNKFTEMKTKGTKTRKRSFLQIDFVVSFFIQLSGATIAHLCQIT
jgi:hypothetical protein